MKHALLMTAALLLGAFVTLEPIDWVVDKSHSRIGFQVRHLGLAKVNGEFKEYDATLTFDPADLATLKASATVQVASVDTGVERRDNHLRSDDFFAAETYPTISFVSKEVRNIDGNTFELVGDLTIRDVTKEVVLDAELLGAQVMGERHVSALEASTIINRFDYGLKWDRVTEAGGLVVSENVEIQLAIEARAEENS